MRLKNKFNRGLSLVELILSVGLISTVAVLSAGSYSSSLKIYGKNEEKKKLNLEIADAFKMILKVGRLATKNSCAIHTSKAIECLIDFNIPPTDDNADDTIVAFELITDSSNKTFLQFTRDSRAMITFSGIKNFIVCDDQAMKSTIGCFNGAPDGIDSEQARRLALEPQIGGRFFRFQLNGLLPSGETRMLRGSFYNRHPLPINDADPEQGELVYQWGLWQK